MSKIIIQFNGWVEADPESVFFQYIGEDLKHYDPSKITGNLITGTEYLKLSSEERDEYILEDLGYAYTNSFDGELEECDVSVEEDVEVVAQEFLNDLLKDKI